MAKTVVAAYPDVLIRQDPINNTSICIQKTSARFEYPPQLGQTFLTIRKMHHHINTDDVTEALIRKG